MLVFRTDHPDDAPDWSLMKSIYGTEQGRLHMESDSLEARVLSLAKRLSGLGDLTARTNYLSHELVLMATATVAEITMLVTSGAEARDPRYTSLFQCLTLALSREECAGLRQSVTALLHASDQPVLALMVLQSDDDATDGEAHRVPDFGWGRPVSLGERKSLARRRDRNLIARVLRDPNRDVISILLGNPIITEADVLRLCARRPIRPAVLREVFCSTRWNPRYPIKVALALNPYSPLDIKLKLAPQLIQPDLRRVLQAADTPVPFAFVCRRLVKRGELH